MVTEGIFEIPFCWLSLIQLINWPLKETAPGGGRIDGSFSIAIIAKQDSYEIEARIFDIELSIWMLLFWIKSKVWGAGAVSIRAFDLIWVLSDKSVNQNPCFSVNRITVFFSFIGRFFVAK